MKAVIFFQSCLPQNLRQLERRRLLGTMLVLTHRHTHTPTHLPIHTPTDLPTYPFTHPHTYPFIHLHTYPSTHLSYVPTDTLTCVHTHTTHTATHAPAHVLFVSTLSNLVKLWIICKKKTVLYLNWLYFKFNPSFFMVQIKTAWPRMLRADIQLAAAGIYRDVRCRYTVLVMRWLCGKMMCDDGLLQL